MHKFRKVTKVFNPLPGTEEPPTFQRYQFDPRFGGTARNYLIRLSPEMMQAMTRDQTLGEQMKVLLAPARKHLLD